MGWKALHCETKHGDHYDFFPFFQSCWVRNTGQGQRQLSTLTEIFETLLKIHFGKRRDQERILHFTHTYIDLKKNILQFGQICFIALPSSITTITSPLCEYGWGIWARRWVSRSEERWWSGRGSVSDSISPVLGADTFFSGGTPARSNLSDLSPVRCPLSPCLE